MDAEFWVDHGEELEQRFVPGRRAERAARRLRDGLSRPGPSVKRGKGDRRSSSSNLQMTALGIRRLPEGAALFPGRRPRPALMVVRLKTPAEDEVEQQLPVEQRVPFSRSPSSTAW